MTIEADWRRAGVLALGLALAGCGSGGAAPPRSAAAAAPTAAPAELDAILALLDAGEAKAARKRIAAALKRDPMNASLLVLRDSLARDPVELLGPAHHPYTVRAGDTMTALAERFLGNRLKAYQLARYNGVERPADLAPGQVLRIPGEARAPERAKRDEPSRSARRRPDAPAKPVAAAPKLKAEAAAPAADPGAARAARAAGLQALNQGQVGRAVGLLRRAARLDPANPLARRDLARAERIASAVRARR